MKFSKLLEQHFYTFQKNTSFFFFTTPKWQILCYSMLSNSLKQKINRKFNRVDFHKLIGSKELPRMLIKHLDSQAPLTPIESKSPQEGSYD